MRKKHSDCLVRSMLCRLSEEDDCVSVLFVRAKSAKEKHE
jgi:hypothetical protein